MQELTIFALIMFYIARKRHVLLIRISESLRQMSAFVAILFLLVFISCFAASLYLQQKLSLPFSSFYFLSPYTPPTSPIEPIRDAVDTKTQYPPINFLTLFIFTMASGPDLQSLVASFSPETKHTFIIIHLLDMTGFVAFNFMLSKMLSTGAINSYVRRANLLPVFGLCIEIAFQLEVIYLTYLAPGSTDTRLLYSILKYAFGRLAITTVAILLTMVRAYAYPWTMGYELKLVKGSRQAGEIKYTVHIPGVNDDECEGLDGSVPKETVRSNSNSKKNKKE